MQNAIHGPIDQNEKDKFYEKKKNFLQHLRNAYLKEIGKIVKKRLKRLDTLQSNCSLKGNVLAYKNDSPYFKTHEKPFFFFEGK